jgi:hypothetical protein
MSGTTRKKKKKKYSVRTNAPNTLVVSSKTFRGTLTVIGVETPKGRRKKAKAYVNVNRLGVKFPHVFEVRAELGSDTKSETVYFVLRRGGDRPANPLSKRKRISLPPETRASLGLTERKATRENSLTVKAEVKTVNGKRIATCFVRLSTFGGSQARIGVTTSLKAWKSYTGSSKARARKRLGWTPWIKTWRKVYYQVSAMWTKGHKETYKNAFERIRDKWHAQYTRAYVELEPLDASIKMITREKYLETDWDTVSEYGESHHREFYPSAVELHIVMADFVRSGVLETDRLGNFATSVDFDQVLLRTFKREGETEWITEPRLRSEWYVELDTVTVNNDRVTPTLKVVDDQYRVQMSLSRYSALIANGQRVAVEVNYRVWARQSAAAAGRTCLIGTDFRTVLYPKRAEQNRSVLKSVVHEAGHLLGIAAYFLPDATEDSKETSIDDGLGKDKGTQTKPSHYYNGNHCKRDFDLRKKTACTMFYSGTLEDDRTIPKNKLCDVCLLALRARVLTKLFKRTADDRTTDYKGYDPKR